MEPLEEYHSPFDFEQGVNSSYLYLSPAYSDTPPSSPAVRSRGNHKEERERLSGGCVCFTGQKEKGKHGFGSLNRKNLGNTDCMGREKLSIVGGGTVFATFFGFIVSLSLYLDKCIPL